MPDTPTQDGQGHQDREVREHAPRILTYLAAKHAGYTVAKAEGPTDLTSWAHRRNMQTAVFAGIYYFPGDVIRTLRWLEDRGLVERHPRARDNWRISEDGIVHLEVANRGSAA